MNNTQQFNIKIEALCLEKYADPPEDPLGELSDFEMGIRRFCFECNYQVLIKIGDEKKLVFSDPDICMLLEDDLPKKILDLSQDRTIELVFAESYCLVIIFVPIDSKVSCILQNFGYSAEKKQFELDKTQVLGVFKRFLDEFMDKAVDGGYITQKDKDRFLLPIKNKAMC